MFGLKQRRRRRLRQRPWPTQWRQIVAKRVPYVATLSADDRRKLEGLVQIFLAEKQFEGCGGLTITDEIRVVIATQACILQLHRDGDCYPQLRQILVYPHTYVAHDIRPQPDGTVIEGPQARLGESWTRGSIVLAWDAALGGAADIHDGHNVVLHEFAHQLDAETGSANGAPILPMRSMYVAWARALGQAYQSLIDDLDRHHRTLLGEYAATNPAEFFAVATENFFERPISLARRRPALYEQLALFYNQDPAAGAHPKPPEGKTNTTPTPIT